MKTKKKLQRKKSTAVGADGMFIYKGNEKKVQ